MDGNGSGATLDGFFKLGTEYVRARFGREPDPSQQGAQAVAIPAATVAQPASSNGMTQYLPVVALVVGVVVLGIVLKKAG